MTPVWLPDDVAEAFLLPRIQSEGVGPMLAMGVLDRDYQIVGCAAIHDWNPEFETCEVSAASDTPRWITKPVLRFFFNHLFDVMKLQMVYAKTASTNPRAQSFWHKLGATEHVIPRGRGRDVHEHLMTLTDDQWIQFRNRLNNH